MPEVAKTYVFKEKSWEPVVIDDGTSLIYEVPVASGHMDKVFRFSITQRHFDVLKRDEERRYFLYAVLHSRYQSRPATAALQDDADIDAVLLAPAPEVETLLTLRDSQSNAAVSNLIRIYMGRNQSGMRSGRWFADRTC